MPHLQRIVLDGGIVDEEIVVAFRSLVADEDTVGIASDKVPGDDRVDRSHQVKGAAAVAGFIGLINSIAGLARAGGGRPGELEAGGCVVVLDGIVADGDVLEALTIKTCSNKACCTVNPATMTSLRPGCS